MSGVQQFTCDACGVSWRDKYTFWRGYQSPCPRCGRSCRAYCDTQVFVDQQEMRGLYNGPVVNYEDDEWERTEADLERERDTIHAEIVEALGNAEIGQVSDEDDTDDTDEDTDAEASGGEF